MKPEQDSRQQPEQTSPQLRVIQNGDELFCPQCGSDNYLKDRKPIKQQISKCLDCGWRFFLPQNHRDSTQLELGEHVWSASQLGLRTNPHLGNIKLNFTAIKQSWLQKLAEKFVKYMAATREYGTLAKYLKTFNTLSRFIAERYPALKLNLINRSVILDFFDYLNQRQLSRERKITYISNLNVFFETGTQNGWFDIPPYLIRKEDYPKPIKRLPRDIPEEVMSQLNQHLDTLPDPVMRMTLVLQECGLRIGELCQLPFDCLKKDGDKEWSIQFRRWKMKKEAKLPISPELAAVIKDQQKYIRSHLGAEYEYLFCTRKAGRKEFIPKPAVMLYASFNNFLKHLAEEFDIRDSSGKRWNFRSHQFRHTVGTRMVNLGVPLPVIQRFLGHDSPEMTMTYAHLKDETMKKAVAEFREKMVNIAGQVVDEFGVAASIAEGADPSEVDAAWLRKNILARALPDGLCKRPAAKGRCPYEVNKCHSCADFLADEKYLPQYKDELERANRMIQWAQQNPQSSRAESVLQDNLAIKNGLENVISGLKANQARTVQ